MSDVTRILNSADSKAAGELLPLIYDELRKLARIKMSKEAPGQTIQATALVHEAWLKLSAARNQDYSSRNHFYGAAAEVMRRILVDRARKRRSQKRRSDLERVEFESIDVPAADDDLILNVHEALRELEQHDPQKCEVVKLKFFVGLTEAEIARLLGISERTVRRHWTFAKAWLGSVLGES